MTNRGLLSFVALTLGLTAASCRRGAAPVAAEPVVHAVAPVTPERVRRVSTAVPFPRGLEMIDGTLYALARGRVRESGGVGADIEDHAGTIYAVDPGVAEPATEKAVSPAVAGNGKAFAVPTSPPFRLWNRTANPPTADRETDRPYCGLRYDPVTKNFYLCAFSGIDKAEGRGSVFSKNTNDAILRYDTRSNKWYEVERHNIEAGGNYPHHDPYSAKPPHGWLNGPDNCLAVGRWLYAVSKDNSMLVRYDLAPIRDDPDAAPPPSYFVLDHKVDVVGHGLKEFHGHSMLAAHGGYLYVGYRTSSVIVRIPLDKDDLPVQPIRAEFVAQFDPYDPATRRSANLTDMAVAADGHAYVISAQPSRVYRFKPDPAQPFDGRTGKSQPWADLSALTGNPKMKSENVFVDAGNRVFVTSGDAYAATHYKGGGGTIYRIDP
jgi:hypothetical protein